MTCLIIFKIKANMSLYNLLLMGEVFFSFMSSKTMFKLMTFLNLYCIAYDCYSAYYTLGALAYVFVLLANMPYIIAIASLLLSPRSLFRRRMVFEVSKLLYAFKFLTDLWTAMNINPE